MRRLVATSTLILVLAAQGGHAKQAAFTYVLLNSLGGHGTHITAINSAGNAVGASETAAGSNHAFVFTLQTRVMQDLGTLGGMHSLANGINDAGQVVGKSEDGAGHEHAFLVEPGLGIVDLHQRFSLGGSNSTALSINNAGVIVGGAEDPNGDLHAIRYDLVSGVLTDLGFIQFGDSGLAFGINDFNDVVGNGTRIDESGSRAFLAESTTSAPVSLVDIAFGGAQTNLQGISNSRVAFGFIKTASGKFHALAYERSKGMTDLGTLGGLESTALAANSKGTVVGQSDTTTEVPHAFIYDSRGMRDLNGDLPPGIVVARATAINDEGLIAGDGWLNNLPRAFVLVPSSSSKTYPYDATGVWHFEVTLKGEVVDNVDPFVTQDADGNLTHCGECEGEQWFFTKLGTPPGQIAYKVALVPPDDAECLASGTGTAVLDTSTNVLTGTMTGPWEDCITPLTATFTMTRY